MVDKTQFEMMARYNQWMNGKLYAVCAEIPNSDRKKDMGAFFKSIYCTLNHILYGDKAWMGQFTGNPFHGVYMGVDLYFDFEELRAECEKMDQEIIDWLKTWNLAGSPEFNK